MSGCGPTLTNVFRFSTIGAAEQRKCARSFR